MHSHVQRSRTMRVLAATIALSALAGSTVALGQSPSAVPQPSPATQPSAAPATSTPAPASQAPTAAPSSGPTAAPTGAAPSTAPSAGPSTAPGKTPRPTATPKADSGTPPEVASNSDAWPMANHDYRNTRSVDGPINSSNVDTLGVAWTFDIPTSSKAGYGALASNPVVLDGVVYFEDLTSNVFALSLDTGEKLWEHDQNVDQLGPNGVAVGYGKVFAVSGLNSIVALDLKDGHELWTTDLRTQNDTEGITIQPLVYNDQVFASTVPGTESDFYKGGVGGVLYALDQKTGKVAWSFDTVASKDLWGNPDINSGGGAWYPPAVDTGTGQTFWGIGNPAPYPGTADFPSGSSRPGPNLYTDSELAISAKGKLDWYDQVRQHDLFDLDFQLSPILTSAKIDGTDRQLVIGGGKLGYAVAFDRKTGDIVWQTAIGRHQNDFLDKVPDAGVTVYPGTLGGMETPMAYKDGLLYIAYLDVPTTYSPSAITGADLTHGEGGLAAVDVTTGKVIWDSHQTSLVLGGATVTNDLVWTSTYDGTILALDAKTGATVWSQQAPAGINAWPAVAGDTILIPAGVGTQPQLIALRLGATGVMPSPAPTPVTSPAPGASSSPSGLSTDLQVATPDENLAFSPSTLTAPAGTSVTVTYTNDSSMPHNIHFFDGPDANSPTLATTEVQTGPGVVQHVTFTTPTQPGTYYFQCDVHSDTMKGMLIVR